MKRRTFSPSTATSNRAPLSPTRARWRWPTKSPPKPHTPTAAATKTKLPASTSPRRYFASITSKERQQGHDRTLSTFNDSARRAKSDHSANSDATNLHHNARIQDGHRRVDRKKRADF